MTSSDKLQFILKAAHTHHNNLYMMFKKDKEKYEDGYSKFAIGLLSIICEHHKSILDLINKRTLSALCLLRPLHEAYIKITWSGHYITTQRVHNIIEKTLVERKDCFPSLQEMSKEIDISLNKAHGTEGINAVSKDLENNLKLFHNYTHGGAYLISINLNKKDVYTDQDKIDLLNSISFYLHMSFNSYCIITRNIELAKKLDKEFKKLINIMS